jgi:hypothetical protein
MNKRNAICEVAYMLGIVIVRTIADFRTVHFTKGFKWQHNCRVCCAYPKETKGDNTSYQKGSVAEKEIQSANYVTAQITFILYIPL